jgi:phage anti-repressor protein
MELFEASETQGLAKPLHEFWTTKNIYNDLLKQRMNTRNTFNREGWF